MPRSNSNRGRQNNGRPRGGGGGGYRDYDSHGGSHMARRSPPRFAPPPYDRGRPESDSWRPADDRRRDDARAPDSYRPRPPQSDFTFLPPSGAPSFTPINYPPPPRGPRRDRGRNQRGRGRGGWRPPHPSERALISGATHNLPEERLNGDGDGAAKFRDLDQLSDDDEQEMEISSHSSQAGSEGPSKKRARTTETAAAGDAAPKWSNPDPYTALPCPDDTLQKKRDVVKLIRKARVADLAKSDAPADTQDYISFDLTSDEEDDIQVVEAPPPPPPSHLLPPPPPPPPASAGLPNKPSLLSSTSAPLPLQDRSGPLGSRKRTANDEIKPPDYGQLKRVSMKPSKGSLVPNWRPKPDEEPCPWATVDHSGTRDMAFRLHKEVIDFYEYVRPRQFEQRIRENLIENMRKAMKRDGRNFNTATVQAFGSFMSGLYLPTADMDLVVCSDSYMRGGPPTYLGARSWLYKFQKFLVAQRVADSDSIEVIAHARIPLVKFVDRLTGLKVDVSFENLGGVDAVDTFLRWKGQYPAMPILVTVIKHYLLMRGLNEPVNGGIGGFSVICLVVSMLQLMPQVQSRSLIPEHHLGEMLLEFFELYGRHFRHDVNAISLKGPVGYIRKTDVSSFAYKNRDRLSIIDPNNPANDISGGSSNTPNILSRFHDAYNVLRDRMKEVASGVEDNDGILATIMRGDYSSFRDQRAYLKHVHETALGPCSDD